MGYTFLSLTRKIDNGCGVGLYISNQHDFKRREDLENTNFESIWIKIFLQKLKFFLVWTIYCVPENSKHLHENFAKFFDDMWSLAVRSFKESNLLGGMNVNYLVKDDRTEIKSVISSHGIEELIK